jgi:hypothetical protein
VGYCRALEKIAAEKLAGVSPVSLEKQWPPHLTSDLSFSGFDAYGANEDNLFLKGGVP